MKKICIVVNSRANYGRIKSVLAAINEHPRLQLQLIVGASALLYRYGEVHNLIKQDGFRIDATVYSIVEGENPTTMAKSTGLAILELSSLFENLKPDIVLTVADRFETIATAIAASYMNIPVAHTQGGEVTGSIDESVRHAVTKLSHIHFAATDRSMANIIRMGEDPSKVYCTGCPSLDVIRGIDLTMSQSIFDRYKGTGPSLSAKNPYLVVLQHPVTTEYGFGFSQIKETLDAVAELKMQTAWLWPNVDAGSDDVSKGLRMYREKNNPNFLHFYRNFSVEDYARLIMNCSVLIGNSSSALREGSFLGVPAVTIGTRQNKRERGDNVIAVDYSAKAIYQAIQTQLNQGKYPSNVLYGDGYAADKIVSILDDIKVNVQKTLFFVHQEELLESI